MVIQRGRKHKPQRGGARHFTSSRELEKQAAQIRRKQEEDGGEGPTGSSSSEGSVSGSGGESGSESESEEASSEEGPAPVKQMAALNVSAPPARSAPNASNRPSTHPAAAKDGPPRGELSRREREAIEKERAYQYFLKKKQEEDAARLVAIRKQREADAAKHAADLKAKEEARLRRR